MYETECRIAMKSFAHNGWCATWKKESLESSVEEEWLRVEGLGATFHFFSSSSGCIFIGFLVGR